LSLISVAALTTVGGFVADWNCTHLFNSDWPPHSKFHDALSIALGALLGACGLCFLWRKVTNPQTDVALGALLPSLFWTDQGASFAFPGAECLEAEFPEKVPRVKGVWINERFASVSMLAQIAAGYSAERRHGT
jgi:hypothetical protein